MDEHSNTLRTPYLFTGKEYDIETGLYYFGARYYDPRTSVWASADPILGDYLDGKPNGGVFDSVNLASYAYVMQNPMRLTDPTGLAGGAEEDRDPREEDPAVQMDEIFAAAEVPDLIRKIQRYNPGYAYETIRRPGERYNGGDVEYLENQLSGQRDAMQDRTDEFADTLKGITRTKVTISITRALDPKTGRVMNVVSSSEGSLRREARGLLDPRRNEVEARGFSSDAEANGVYYAKSRGWKPLVSTASREICGRCQATLNLEDVMPGSKVKAGGPTTPWPAPPLQQNLDLE